MTAFYMFRLYFRIFHGKPQDEEAYAHAHESPPSMTIPLCVLAFLAVVSGGFVIWGAWFTVRVNSEILAPHGVVGAAEVAFYDVAHIAHDVHYGVMAMSVTAFLVAVGGAFCFFHPKGFLYGRELVRPGTPIWPVYVFCKNLWYVNPFLVWLALRVLHTCHVICGYFDRKVIDGFVNYWGTICQFTTAAAGTVDYWGVDGAVRGIGNLCMSWGRRLRRLQTGLLQEYLYASLYLSGGVVVVLLVLFYLFQNDWYTH